MFSFKNGNLGFFCIIFLQLRLDTSALSIKEEEAVDDYDSVVRSFCKDMIDDLANPKWEIRHGAALGLVVLLKFACARSVLSGSYHNLI